MSVSLDLQSAKKFISKEEILSLSGKVRQAHQKLHDKTGKGAEFTGWVTLPEDYDRQEFGKIKKCAKKIQQDSDVLIVIGIGGSYLGAQAGIDVLLSPFYNQKKKDTPDIYFAGNNISSDYIHDLLEILGERDFSINVVSKSGTTTEPAIAFRIFKQLLVQKYGEREAAGRIYATTDQKKGALKTLADREGYETFVIPDDIGGRYSVLTPVGLLPMAVGGADIDKIMEGAGRAYQDFLCDDLSKNIAYQYAAVRNILYHKGKTLEILVNYDPALKTFAEWFKQLFAESEGKENKGIFPVSANFSTDLHSIGQYIQQGIRNLFETVLWVEKPKNELFIPFDREDIDGLNFLSGKDIQYVNHKAFLGTTLAHTDGDVPNIAIKIPQIDAYHFGYLIYFFEKACAINGYLLDINPFDQPGVEEYKKNMFALLGKPGYEDRKNEMEKRIK